MKHKIKLPEMTVSDGSFFIGADYCDKSKELNLAIFNKDTNAFEYMTKLKATNKDKAMVFAEAVRKYFNGTLIYEL
jgi:hypothetical protein